MKQAIEGIENHVVKTYKSNSGGYKRAVGHNIGYLKDITPYGATFQQLNWVKSYLQYVPKGAHLFVCMHAPAYFYNENYKLGRVAAVSYTHLWLIRATVLYTQL